MDFKARNIIVTGGANGIGAAVAQAFLEHGARVAIVDANAEKGVAREKQLREQYEHIHFIESDVADFDACAAALERIESLIGPVDTLINNAGISPKQNGRGLDIDAMDIAEWRRVIDVNLHGVFNFSKAVAPGMKQRRFGRIVSMSSVAGKAYLDVCAAHYSATKAAVIGLTRHLAGELGPHGITVNAVAPGRIDTDMVAMAGAAANQIYIRQTPLQRLGTPREVADLCLYLCSAKEAGFVTGQVVDVAGGWLMT